MKIDPDEDYYKYVVHSHDTQVDMLNDALAEVRIFIAKRKLILVGGMAIDFALKLKGDKLYDDHVLPDYDFISMNFIKDSRDLGEILCKKGMDVSIINALHINTIKVRVNFVTVADITYSPPFIFNSIPTLRYEDIIFIHPSYQRIDMHLSIGTPLNYPPLENIYFRMKKDMTRFQLLEDKYPMTMTSMPQNLKTCTKKLPKLEVKFIENYLTGQCIGGMTAYYILRNIAKNKPPSLFTKGKICIYSNNPDELLALLKKDFGKKIIKNYSYAPILDKVPPRIEVVFDYHTLIIFDNRNNKFAASDIILQPNGIKTSVINPQGLMVYLLFMYFNKLYQFKSMKKDIQLTHAKEYYIAYCKLKSAVENIAGLENISTNQMILLPTVESYGTSSLSHSIELIMRPIKDKLDGKPQVEYRPKNIYPIKTNDSTSCKPLKDQSSEFNLKEAEYYKIDGQFMNTNEDDVKT